MVQSGLRRRLSRLRHDDRGVSALELVIIGPSLIITIFFAIQLGFYLYGRSVALQAAREGVSQLRLADSVDGCQALAASAQTTAQDFADQIGGASLHGALATADCSGAGAAENPQVSVTVTGSAVSLVPFLFSPGVTQTATGAVEHFQPPVR